jgi:plastocyanin
VLALAGGVALAIVVAAFPSGDAIAAGPGQIVASDFQFSNPSSGDSTVTIGAGETVVFSYPSGSSNHNVDFTGSSPTSCTQTAGSNVGPVPPLPAFPTAEGWAGTCRFDTPGTYSFHCDAHGFMTGSVVVQGSSTGTDTTPIDTTPTQTTPRGTTPTGTTPTDPGPTGSAPPKPPVIRVAKRQTWNAVHGTVTTPAGPSSIAVTLLASKRTLGASKLVTVGSTRKNSKGTGKTSFTAKLRSAGRLALNRRGRLALTVRVAVTPPDGAATRKMYAVTLRRREPHR